MGFDPSCFLEGQDLDAFICSICQEILKDPQHAGCADDHVFCCSCLRNHIASTSTSRFSTTFCPLCRARIKPDQTRPGPFVRRQIDRLRVRCGDCDWVGTVGDKHGEACEKRIVRCENMSDRGVLCDWEGPKDQLETHQTFCPHAKVECPRPACSTVLRRKDLERHSDLCAGYTCTFGPVDGCPFTGRKTELVVHSRYCAGIHSELALYEQHLESEQRSRQAAEDRLAAAEERLAKALGASEIEENKVEKEETPDDEDMLEAEEAEITLGLRPVAVSHSPPPFPVPASHSHVDSSPTQDPSSPTSPFTYSSSPFTYSSSPASISPQPFNLTTSIPLAGAAVRRLPLPPSSMTTTNDALSRNPLLPTRPSSGPFNLTATRPPAPPTASRPFSLTSRKLPSAATTMQLFRPPRVDLVDDDGNGDEEAELGRWERGGAKRPRFDGGFPREWEETG